MQRQPAPAETADVLPIKIACAVLRLSVLEYLELCSMAQNLRVGAGCHARPW
jgi:hypothetical protein